MVGIVTTGHDVADARLHRTVAALQRAGAEVWVRGLGDAAKGPSGAKVTTASRSGKATRLLRALVWPWQGRADVLLTIDPDTALSARLATRFRGRRWVADVHEDYRELLRDRAWVPRPLLGLLRGGVSVLNSVISRADLVLAADVHLPPRARNRYVMRNEPDVTVLPAMPAEEVEMEHPRALYIGDNRTSRGLRVMVEAVAATAGDETPWALDLVGPIASRDKDWFTIRMRRPDARHIRFHDRQPPREAWRLADGASVGLCLLEDTPAFRDAMPSKVYEYLAMGLPTIATPLPRVVQLLEGEEAGVIVRDAAETTAALRRFAGDDQFRWQLVTGARVAGERLRYRPSTYDEAAGRIAQLVR